MGDDSGAELVAKLVVAIVIITIIFVYESCQDKKFNKEHPVTEIEGILDVPTE